MGKEVRFLNSIKNSDGSYNVTYGVDDFNKITSCLIGSGVAPFPSKDTYTADELNAMTEAVVSSGASIGGLKVSLVNNVITIAQGIGFFSNGATIEVDSEGVTLDYAAAEVVYVYAAYDASLNLCDFYASDTEPAETDNYFVIKLAQISIEGTVTDVRSFAVSKVGTLGRNVPIVIDVYGFDGTDDRKYFNVNSIIWASDFDVSRFNGVHIQGTPFVDYAGKIDAAIHNNAYVFNAFITLERLYSGEDILIYSYNPSTSTRYRISVRCLEGRVELYAGVADASTDDGVYVYKLRISFY